MNININKAFSDWYDAQPSEPTYQESFEAGQRSAMRDTEGAQFKQFLSDVHTAAGLIEHGKQSKALSKRLGDGVLIFMP